MVNKTEYLYINIILIDCVKMNKTSGKNTRKCSACQQVGHRKVSSQCPKYVKVVKNNRRRTVNESEMYKNGTC